MVLLKKRNNIIKYGKKSGGSILNRAIDNMPFEMHLIDNNLSRYNFCGPGSQLNKRISYNSDGTLKIITPPKNKLDESCMYHDLSYEKYKDIQHRNIADEKLKKAAEEFLKNKNLTILDKINGQLVNGIMNYKIKNKI